MSFLQGLRDGLRAAEQFTTNIEVSYAVGQLIGLERDSATEILKDFVQSHTREQFDHFQSCFLNASMGMISTTQRIRAMELYAYLKILETLHFNEWRGFSTGTNARALN